MSAGVDQQRGAGHGAGGTSSGGTGGGGDNGGTGNGGAGDTSDNGGTGNSGDAGGNGGADPSNGGLGGGAAANGSDVIESHVTSARYRNLLKPCHPDGSCDTGSTCFHLTRELSFCDQAQPAEPTMCSDIANMLTGMSSPYADECGCDGKVCAEGEVCALRTQYCSCNPYHYNVCIEQRCTSPADCPAGQVCVPPSIPQASHCMMQTCGGDSDCTDSPKGRCVLYVMEPMQAGDFTSPALVCVYG